MALPQIDISLIISRFRTESSWKINNSIIICKTIQGTSTEEGGHSLLYIPRDTPQIRLLNIFNITL
jgi:hypothetical protein